MSLYVAPIIEGETEERCVKLLLSRIWRDLLAAADREELCVLDPNPANRGSLVKHDHPELGERVELSFRLMRSRMRQPGDRGFILILLDADEDCPKTLAERLLTRARAARSDAGIACVLAKRELENWFKAAAASLAGLCGLPADLEVPANPEDGSGDAWLTKQMRKKDRRQKYTKPADALALVEKMDLHQCRANSRSFRKLCKELEARLPPPGPPPAPEDLPPPDPAA
jgi:hypothetical protein